MSLHYLIDENVAPLYKRQLLKRNPEIRVYAVGDPGCPPRSTLDPEILLWCEDAGCLLVTNNRASMPTHLADHLAQGHHIPGILIITAVRRSVEPSQRLLVGQVECLPSRSILLATAVMSV